MKGREGILKDWFPSAHTQAGTESVSSPCLRRANSPLCSPEGSILTAGAVRLFLSAALIRLCPQREGVPFRRYSARSQTTWEKPGVCDRKCRGRRVKALSIILRLGRNSPRESEYSCFPRVCCCYSFICSLDAEPKTIAEKTRGPLGMLPVSNSYNSAGQSSTN